MQQEKSIYKYYTYNNMYKNKNACNNYNPYNNISHPILPYNVDAETELFNINKRKTLCNVALNKRLKIKNIIKDC